MKKQLIINNEVVEMTFEEVFKEFETLIYKEIDTQKGMFDRLSEGREDMYQEASLQMYNAFQNYDIETKHAFRTYLGRYIQKGVQYETVRNNVQKRDGGVHISIEQNLSENEEEFSLSNVLINEFDFDSPMIARDIVKDSINIMTDLEVEYLHLMLNSYIVSEIANKFNITRQSTNEKCNKVKDKIRLTATKYNY